MKIEWEGTQAKKRQKMIKEKRNMKKKNMGQIENNKQHSRTESIYNRYDNKYKVINLIH